LIQFTEARMKIISMHINNSKQRLKIILKKISTPMLITQT